MPTQLQVQSQPSTSVADIRSRIDTLLTAIRSMDIEGVMPIYAPDIVSFDIEPPLQHVGAEAKRHNWSKVFAAHRPPLGYEVRDLTITAADDVAFARSLARMSGTFTNGRTHSSWVRWTSCFCRIAGVWLIVHDQISVPLDIDTGRALLNLEP